MQRSKNTKPYPYPKYGGKYSQNPRDYSDELMKMIDPGNMQDDEVPKIDLVEEFDPDNPNVKTNPLLAALSLGMQQMPGGIKGMNEAMIQFMKATETHDWSEDNVDTNIIGKMMFNPNARTISRIISLMDARYEEVEEQEQELIAERITKLRREARKKLLKELQEEERLEKEQQEKEKNKRKEDDVQQNIKEDDVLCDSSDLCDSNE